MGAETALIVGTTIAMGAASMAQSAAQNKSSRKIAEYQNRQQAAAFAKSVAVQREQAVISGAEKKRALHARYDALQGASRVASAERGAASSRSSESILNAMSIQTARESAKINLEQALGSQSFAISNQPMWQVGQTGSTFLAGIQGGLQGLSMGLSMANSYSQNQLAQQQLGAMNELSPNFVGPPSYLAN